MMSAPTCVPRIPGTDLDVEEVDNENGVSGVAFIDPSNSSAYIWAREVHVAEVGSTSRELPSD